MHFNFMEIKFHPRHNRWGHEIQTMLEINKYYVYAWFSLNVDFPVDFSDFISKKMEQNPYISKQI